MSQTSKFTFELGLNLSTALRATEAVQGMDQRIFDADFDYRMLPKTWRLLLLPGPRHLILGLLESSGMGTPGMLFCRTRFIDDALADWLDGGEQQVVCLGAGNDSRAYRIPGIAHAQYFEVDLPAPQALKREHMQKMLGTIPPQVTHTALDLNTQDLAAELVKHGFRLEIPTFFIMEGVTQYISGQAVDKVFRFAAQASKSSRFAFTFIKREIIDGSARSSIDQRIMKRVARRGMPWVFGIDEQKIEEWLNQRGFKLVDQAGAADYREMYLDPVGRQLNIYTGESIVLAEVP
jgi:methyltransferase (TIGR00027 family)